MTQNAYLSGVAFIDEKILPISEAKISVLDWGLLHSDATYDVVHVYDGAFFRLDDHIKRFESGMARLQMSINYNTHQLKDILTRCVRLSGLHHAYVEMVCTRGVPKPGSRDPRDCVNQFFAFAVPFSWIANERQRAEGLKLHISDVQRIDPAAVDPTIKNYHWMDLTRGLFAAYEHDQDTAVLVDGKGNVVEGPGFNIFALVKGKWVTPAKGILMGITRRTAIDLAREKGIEVAERELAVQELRNAQEIFITSTAGGIMPVTQVDGMWVGDGTIGPTTKTMIDAYWKAHSDPRYSTPAY